MQVPLPPGRERVYKARFCGHRGDREKMYRGGKGTGDSPDREDLGFEEGLSEC